MKRKALSRRLLAGAAGLAVGLAGAIALTTPAQATNDRDQPVDIDIAVNSTCDELGFVIEYSEKADGEIEVRIEAGPAIQKNTLAPGETLETSFFPRVSYKIFVDDALMKAGQWEDTDDCGEPTVLVNWELQCDAIALEVTTPRTFEVAFVTREDDDDFALDLEPGVTATPTLGNVTEDTVVVITYDGETVETIEWEEPEGCDEPATDDGTAGDNGAKDELAATGSPTLWIAGAAVALLAVGGGLFFLTRRRNVDFTA